jgi:hypothetical protein
MKTYHLAVSATLLFACDTHVGVDIELPGVAAIESALEASADGTEASGESSGDYNPGARGDDDTEACSPPSSCPAVAAFLDTLSDDEREAVTAVIDAEPETMVIDPPPPSPDDAPPAGCLPADESGEGDDRRVVAEPDIEWRSRADFEHWREQISSGRVDERDTATREAEAIAAATDRSDEIQALQAAFIADGCADDAMADVERCARHAYVTAVEPGAERAVR